jgi:hypothetical protein
MTNKEKIKFLSQYTKLQIEFENSLENYKRLLNNLSYPAAKINVLSHAPSSKGNSGENPIEMEYLRLLRAESVLGNIQRRLATIEDCINMLDDSVQRTVLRLRYIDGLTWEKICVKISYEWAWTHRIHSSALEKLQLK